MAAEIHEHFNDIKSERMEIDLKLIYCFQLNLEEVLFENVDCVRRKMVNNGLSREQILQLKAFRKRERAKLRRKEELKCLNKDLNDLQSERDDLLMEMIGLKEEIVKYQKWEIMTFIEELNDPTSYQENYL